MGLTTMDADVLKRAREVIRRKPEDALKYLTGADPENTIAVNRAMMALALSAMLDEAKARLATMHVANAVAEFVKANGGTKKEDQE